MTLHSVVFLLANILVVQAARSRKRLERGASAIACLARRGSLLVMSDRILRISSLFPLLRGFFLCGSSMSSGGGGGRGIGWGCIFGFNFGLDTFFCGRIRSLVAKGGFGGPGGLASGSAIGLTAGVGATLPSLIAILAAPAPGGGGGRLPPFITGINSGCAPGADGPK